MDSQFVARDLWEGIYDALRLMIINGEYAQGERLLETELAERFGTSRAPIRTALKELERLGLVEVIPRRGTYVRPVSNKDVEELFSVFALIIPFAIRRAMARVTDADIERLEAASRYAEDQAVFQDRIRANTGFFRLIFEIADHRRLAEIYDQQSSRVQVVYAFTGRHEVNPETDGLTRDVVEAFRSRDAEKAIAVFRGWQRITWDELEHGPAKWHADAFGDHDPFGAGDGEGDGARGRRLLRVSRGGPKAR